MDIFAAFDFLILVSAFIMGTIAVCGFALQHERKEVEKKRRKAREDMINEFLKNL